MDFPLTALMDEHASYRRLLQILHPDGLHCPGCGARDGHHIHRRRRDPLIDYRCPHCGRVFNAFSGTALQGTRRSPAQILLILRGIIQGVPTAQLARELDVNRPRLLELRHKIQARALAAAERAGPLPDAAVEADELYQNAGEKRPTALRPGRPAPGSRQQGPGARHLGQRPAAAAGRRRPAVGTGATAAGPADVGGGLGRLCGRGDAAGDDGVHRRVGGVPRLASPRAGARVGPARGPAARVGAGR